MELPLQHPIAAGSVLTSQLCQLYGEAEEESCQNLQIIETGSQMYSQSQQNSASSIKPLCLLRAQH